MTGTPSPGFNADAAGTRRPGEGNAIAGFANVYGALAGRLGAPLTEVLAALDALLRDAGDGERRAGLERARAAAVRCRDVLEQLGALQRGGVFQRMPVSAAQLFGHVTVATAGRRSGTPIRWREELAPEAPEVAGDPFRLQLALEALAVNALEAVTEYRGEGRIVLSAAPTPDGRLAVRVTDDGPGMSPAGIARATEPFYSTKPEGLGLGLTLARAVVAEHQGELTIDSTLGAGTTITLALPAWSGRRSARVESAAPTARPSRTALLALNDPDAVLELAAACERIGWRYHVAVSADDAALLASRGGYDAAIVATGLLAGETTAADIIERQRGLRGRVIRLRLPDGPPTPGAITMPDSPEALAVTLGLALSGQAGAGW